MNTNVVFEHQGRQIIVEVQLHLRALFRAAKVVHLAYEVARAKDYLEVIGPPFRFGKESEYERKLQSRRFALQWIRRGARKRDKYELPTVRDWRALRRLSFLPRIVVTFRFPPIFTRSSALEPSAPAGVAQH